MSISILLKGSRPGRRAARPSIREVRLLGGARPGPGWASGDRVSLSGRSYRVADAQPRCPDGAPGYVHLADEDEDEAARPGPGPRI